MWLWFSWAADNTDFCSILSVFNTVHSLSVAIQLNITADIAEIPFLLSFFFLFQLPSGVSHGEFLLLLEASLNKQWQQVVGQVFTQTKELLLMDSCLSKQKLIFVLAKEQL